MSQPGAEPNPYESPRPAEAAAGNPGPAADAIVSLPDQFITWMAQRYAADPNYAPLQLPGSEQFDLCFRRSGSLTKGHQTLLFKRIPSALSVDHAQQLRAERDLVVRSRTSLFKLLQDFMVFFYVVEAPIPEATLMHLADFRRVEKNPFGNISQLRFLLETAHGSYLMPESSGWFGWLPIKNLRAEMQTEVLEPFRHWRQAQGPPQ